MIRTLKLGSRIGPWEIVSYLGSGGSGQVFQGRDAAGRCAALKWVPPQHPSRVQLEAMLRDEAYLGELLQHPGIVHVQGLLAGPGGSLVLLMEHMDGGSLRNALKRARRQGMPVACALAMTHQLCLALDHAHRLCDGATGRHLGIVHRDVSPGNVLFTRSGVAKIGDFGIAMAQDRNQATISGTVKGKLAYLAPEQAQHTATDARTDVYALGLTLAESAVGVDLAHGLSVSRLLVRAATADVDPSGLLAALPKIVRDIVTHATALEPGARYPSAAHMADAIARCGHPLAAEHELAAWLASLEPTEMAGRLDALLDDLEL